MVWLNACFLVRTKSFFFYSIVENSQWLLTKWLVRTSSWSSEENPLSNNLPLSINSVYSYRQEFGTGAHFIRHHTMHVRAAIKIGKWLLVVIPLILTHYMRPRRSWLSDCGRPVSRGLLLKCWLWLNGENYSVAYLAINKEHSILPFWTSYRAHIQATGGNWFV